VTCLMIGTGRERDEALITVLGESMPRGTTKRQHTRCGLFLSTYVFFESVEHLVEVVGPCPDSGSIPRQVNARDMPSVACARPGTCLPHAQPSPAGTPRLLLRASRRLRTRPAPLQDGVDVPHDPRATPPCPSSGSIPRQANARDMPSIALRAPGQLPLARAPFNAARFPRFARAECRASRAGRAVTR